MAEENKQVRIDNTALVEAIQTMKKDPNNDNLNAVARLVQTAKFVVPAVLIENTEAVEKEDGRVALENKKSFKFHVLSNSDGKKYMAVFTSPNEVKKGESKLESKNFLVMDVIAMMSVFKKPENEKDIEGIVIDPFSNNFVVPKNIVLQMAETEFFNPKPNEQVKISVPTRYPDGFIDAVRDALDEDGRVNQLFILILERANKAKSLLVIVDEVDPDAEKRKELFGTISKLLVSFTEGMHVMFVPYTDPFAKNATENKLPCYRK